MKELRKVIREGNTVGFKFVLNYFDEGIRQARLVVAFIWILGKLYYLVSFFVWLIGVLAVCSLRWAILILDVI